MNYKMIGRFIAQILLIETLFMLPAVFICLYYGERSALNGFLLTLVLLCALQTVLFLLCKGAKSAFYAREGFVCVGLSWLILSFMGALPFYFSKEIPSLIDAMFEMVSGFTTTGSSILTDVESLSRGLLYWRSFSHWLGGMGVLVFLLALAPASDSRAGGFTMHLLRAESPGPDVGKLTPKIKKTALTLYIIYVALTIVTFIFLICGRMPVFDAVCTAFGTAGTGGFGIKADSMSSYSPYIQNVCTVFMFLFGVNFSCYYLILLGKVKNVLKDEELRAYFGIVIAGIILVAINVRGLYGSVFDTIRHSAFQVVSIMTTTGFATTDFNLWPAFSKTVLLILMIIGGCAGSTGGGLKVGRMLLLFKSIKRNIQQIVRPRKVMAVRNNGKPVDEKVISNANAYLAAYFAIIVLSVLIISIDNFSVETNISSVLACFNNIGPAFGAAGPMSSFAGFSGLSKVVLIFDMLAGRLEIFPIIILFSGSVWKHR